MDLVPTSDGHRGGFFRSDSETGESGDAISAICAHVRKCLNTDSSSTNWETAVLKALSEELALQQFAEGVADEVAAGLAGLAAPTRTLMVPVIVGSQDSDDTDDGSGAVGHSQCTLKFKGFVARAICTLLAACGGHDEGTTDRRKSATVAAHVSIVSNLALAEDFPVMENGLFTRAISNESAADMMHRVQVHRHEVSSSAPSTGCTSVRNEYEMRVPFAPIVLAADSGESVVPTNQFWCSYIPANDNELQVASILSQLSPSATSTKAPQCSRNLPPHNTSEEEEPVAVLCDIFSQSDASLAVSRVVFILQAETSECSDSFQVQLQEWVGCPAAHLVASKAVRDAVETGLEGTSFETILQAALVESGKGGSLSVFWVSLWLEQFVLKTGACVVVCLTPSNTTSLQVSEVLQELIQLALADVVEEGAETATVGGGASYSRLNSVASISNCSAIHPRSRSSSVAYSVLEQPRGDAGIPVAGWEINRGVAHSTSRRDNNPMAVTVECLCCVPVNFTLREAIHLSTVPETDTYIGLLSSVVRALGGSSNASQPAEHIPKLVAHHVAPATTNLPTTGSTSLKSVSIVESPPTHRQGDNVIIEENKFRRLTETGIFDEDVINQGPPVKPESAHPTRRRMSSIDRRANMRAAEAEEHIRKVAELLEVVEASVYGAMRDPSRHPSVSQDPNASGSMSMSMGDTNNQGPNGTFAIIDKLCTALRECLTYVNESQQRESSLCVELAETEAEVRELGALLCDAEERESRAVAERDAWEATNVVSSTEFRKLFKKLRIEIEENHRKYSTQLQERDVALDQLDDVGADAVLAHKFAEATRRAQQARRVSKGVQTLISSSTTVTRKVHAPAPALAVANSEERSESAVSSALSEVPIPTAQTRGPTIPEACHADPLSMSGSGHAYVVDPPRGASVESTGSGMHSTSSDPELVRLSQLVDSLRREVREGGSTDADRAALEVRWRKLLAAELARNDARHKRRHAVHEKEIQSLGKSVGKLEEDKRNLLNSLRAVASAAREAKDTEEAARASSAVALSESRSTATSPPPKQSPLRGCNQSPYRGPTPKEHLYVRGLEAKCKQQAEELELLEEALLGTGAELPSKRGSSALGVATSVSESPHGQGGLQRRSSASGGYGGTSPIAAEDKLRALAKSYEDLKTQNVTLKHALAISQRELATERHSVLNSNTPAARSFGAKGGSNEKHRRQHEVTKVLLSGIESLRVLPPPPKTPYIDNMPKDITVRSGIAQAKTTLRDKVALPSHPQQAAVAPHNRASLEHELSSHAASATFGDASRSSALSHTSSSSPSGKAKVVIETPVKQSLRSTHQTVVPTSTALRRRSVEGGGGGTGTTATRSAPSVAASDLSEFEDFKVERESPLQKEGTGSPNSERSASRDGGVVETSVTPTRPRSEELIDSVYSSAKLRCLSPSSLNSDEHHKVNESVGTDINSACHSHASSPISGTTRFARSTHTRYDPPPPLSEAASLPPRIDQTQPQQSKPLSQYPATKGRQLEFDEDGHEEPKILQDSAAAGVSFLGVRRRSASGYSIPSTPDLEDEGVEDTFIPTRGRAGTSVIPPNVTASARSASCGAEEVDLRPYRNNTPLKIQRSDTTHLSEYDEGRVDHVDDGCDVDFSYDIDEGLYEEKPSSKAFLADAANAHAIGAEDAEHPTQANGARRESMNSELSTHSAAPAASSTAIMENTTGAFFGVSENLQVNSAGALTPDDGAAPPATSMVDYIGSVRSRPGTPSRAISNPVASVSK